jgi:8-oxo-dGTP pyrophosphatase MutT (NUDIX family)
MPVTDPVPAATVIIARQQANEIQIYLLKRSAKSRFMAGNYVFPGGVVEPEDGDLEFWDQYTDLDIASLNHCLGGEIPVAQAMAYCVAAIRETFEEAGVLLTQKDGHPTGGLDQICEMRLTQDLPGGWLKQEVQRSGLILQVSALKRWSRWITPTLMSRRYDTRFFITALPGDQMCRPDKRETTHGIWVNPLQALNANQTGAMPLSPPTLVTLHQLISFENLEALIQAAEKRFWEPALEPRLIPTEEGPVILEPWDPQYAEPDAAIDPKALSAGLVKAAGAPFSRLWLNSGIWYPVAVAR